MLQPDRPILDHDPETRVPFGELLAKSGDAFDETTNSLARILVVVDGHEVIDPFRLKGVRLSQELDAVTIGIVGRSRLELLGRSG